MWYNVIITNHKNHKKEEIAMTNYNTLGNHLKRRILRFTDKISGGFTKPERKFIADMVFGIIASNSCKLTDIGRVLKESVALKKTVERLGRNLANFSQSEALMHNYLAVTRESLDHGTMLLIDGGDVTKPCSSKMEAIGTVYDASTGEYGDGYWTMGVAALTSGNIQPLPVYEKLYPCKKQGGAGFKVETANALQYLRDNFDSSIPRIFDRGFDSGDLIKALIADNEKFILRVNQNRVAVHNGEITKIDDIAAALVCSHKLTFHSKTGNISDCKIGMTRVVLPNVGKFEVNLVVCKEWGDKPLVLYTNLDETVESLAVRVVKAYLMRWRIEELYAFKKQGLNFEDFRIRSLKSIQTLDILLTAAIGFIGAICEKINTEILVTELIYVSKRIPKYSKFLKTTKFYYYAILSGISCVFAYLKCGIAHFFKPKPISYQLCIQFP
jgi:hypothetical protein